MVGSGDRNTSGKGCRGRVDSFPTLVVPGPWNEAAVELPVLTKSGGLWLMSLQPSYMSVNRILTGLEKRVRRVFNQCFHDNDERGRKKKET